MKIRIGIMGYGNLGKGVESEILKSNDIDGNKQVSQIKKVEKETFKTTHLISIILLYPPLLTVKEF